MGSVISRITSIDSAPRVGESDAPSLETHPANTSSQRRTEAPVPRALAHVLARLSRNRPRTGAAHEAMEVHRGLPALPLEFIRKIADNLPSKDNDVSAFADTCKSLRYALEEEKRSVMLAARARRVHTPGQAMALLSEIQADISRLHLRSQPLEALAEAIDLVAFTWGSYGWQSDIDNNERTELYDGILTAVMQIPSKDDRPNPLVALIPVIPHLPSSKQLSRFDDLFEQTMNHAPEHRVRLLAALAPLASLFKELSADDLNAKFGAFIEQVRRLPEDDRSQLLEKLYPTLDFMPASTAKFDTFLAEIRQLPARYQALMLTSLAPHMKMLPTDATTAAFEHAMQVVEQLPPEQRIEPLIALIQQIQLLPQAARTAAFDLAFRETLRSDRPEDQAISLVQLANQIEGLPAAARGRRRTEIHNAIAQLPSSSRKPGAWRRSIAPFARLVDWIRRKTRPNN